MADTLTASELALGMDKDFKHFLKDQCQAW